MSVLFVCSLLFHSLHAQDARFSQPWTSPLMINPALSGNFDGYLRIGGTSSWQKSGISQVAHQYAYLDNRLNRKNNDSLNAFWGFGLTYYQYGDDPFGFLVTRTPLIGTFAAFTLAYHFNLDKKGMHSMGVGAQFANANGKLDESRGAYDKEIGGGGFNFLEIDPTKRRRTIKNYVDYNAGFYYRFRNESLVLETGFSMYHLTSPANTLIGDVESRENRRAVMHVTLNVKLNPRNALVFRNIYYSEGLYWRSPVLDNNFVLANWMGMEFQRMRPKNDVFLHAGLFSRSFKTVMPYLSVYLGRNVNLRASYEQPLYSKINALQYEARRIEGSLIFTFYDKSREDRRNTPSDAVNW